MVSKTFRFSWTGYKKEDQEQASDVVHHSDYSQEAADHVRPIQKKGRSHAVKKKDKRRDRNV